MNDAISNLGNLIQSAYQSLKEALIGLSSKLEESPNDDLRFTKLELERYISWAFGEYAEGKLGQEVSWSWIEWALNSSLPDLFGPYERAYDAEMKNGATLFVNFTI